MQVDIKQKHSRTTKVNLDENTVVKTHVTQHGDGDKVAKTYHKMQWTFDFKDVTHEELLEVASRELVIGARPKFKKCPINEVKSWEQKTFSVRKILDAERTSLSPEEKAVRALQGLTPEQLAEVLKAVQK